MAEDNQRGATADDRTGADAQLKMFDILCRLFMHADRYIWARFQMITAIQVGVIGGAYAVKDDAIVAIALLLLGILLTVALVVMVRRDEETRQHYLENYLDDLGEQLFRPPIYADNRGFRFIPPRTWWTFKRGAGEAIYFVFAVLLLADAFLIVCFSAWISG